MSETERDLARTEHKVLMVTPQGNCVRVDPASVEKCKRKGFSLVDDGPMDIDPGWVEAAPTVISPVPQFDIEDHGDPSDTDI